MDRFFLCFRTPIRKQMNGGFSAHDWGTGLTDCSYHPRSCAETLFCLPCVISRQLDSVNAGGSAPFGGNCVLALFFHPCMVCHLRQRVGDKYKIPVTCVQAACAAVFCELCSACQTYRELESRHERARLPGPGSFCPADAAAMT